MKVRPAVIGDVDEIIRVCESAWKGIWAGDRQMFIDRITTFPECGIVVGEVNGRVEGYVSIQLSGDDRSRCSNWNEATDHGSIRGTHNPDGEWMHGVGLAVTPRGCHAGLTGELIEYLYLYMVSTGKRGCRFITRIPGYYRVQAHMTPEEYVRCRHNGRSVDPELRVLEHYGFRVVEPPVILKDYVEGGGDPGSCGYSVLIEQLNPVRVGRELQLAGAAA